MSLLRALEGLVTAAFRRGLADWAAEVGGTHRNRFIDKMPRSVSNVAQELMPYAIELHFDDVSTRTIAALWATLEEISGKPQRSELGVQPHVSLTVLADAPTGLENHLRQVAQRNSPFDLRFGGIEHFASDEGVVFIGATMSERLRQIHAEVSEVLRRLAVVNSRFYEIERWRPHCTVATDLSAASLNQVIHAAAAADRPSVVRVNALCGVWYRPATLDFRAMLEGPRGG